MYSCDHYVEPDHLLGNIKDTPLRMLVASESSAVPLRPEQVRHVAEVLQGMPGSVRLLRRVPAQPLHQDTRRRGRAQLPVRRLQGLLY